MSYGFKTVLQLDGKDYDVQTCSYSFNKEINEDGEVTSKIKGGSIYLSLMDIPKKSVLEWAIKHRHFKEGIITVVDQQADASIIHEEISFANAACTRIKIMYQRDSTGYFTTLLTISPEDICVGRNNCWINKNWTK